MANQTPADQIDELLVDALEAKGHTMNAEQTVNNRLKLQLERSMLFMLLNPVDMTKVVQDGNLDVFFGGGDRAEEQGIIMDMPNGCIATVHNQGADEAFNGPRYAIKRVNTVTPWFTISMDELVASDKDIVDHIHDQMNTILAEWETQAIQVRQSMKQDVLTAVQLVIFDWPRVMIKKEAYQIQFHIRASVGIAAVALTGDATCTHPFLKTQP